jgi:hypothetical protein
MGLESESISRVFKKVARRGLGTLAFALTALHPPAALANDASVDLNLDCETVVTSSVMGVMPVMRVIGIENPEGQGILSISDLSTDESFSVSFNGENKTEIRPLVLRPETTHRIVMQGGLSGDILVDALFNTPYCGFPPIPLIEVRGTNRLISFESAEEMLLQSQARLNAEATCSKADGEFNKGDHIDLTLNLTNYDLSIYTTRIFRETTESGIRVPMGTLDLSVPGASITYHGQDGVHYTRLFDSENYTFYVTQVEHSGEDFVVASANLTMPECAVSQ